MTDFSIHPMTAALGAEIRNIDLREPCDADTVAALRVAWLDNLVLIFRDQDIGEDDQVRFAEYFGETVGARSKDRTDGGDRRLMLISNIRENGEPIGLLPDGELMFHSDSVFLEKPLMGAMLYAEEIPSTGGNTMFANMYDAYDALPDALKDRLNGLRAVNVFDYETQVRTGRFDRSKAPHATHPAVRTHPETGRKALYVNRLMTEEFVGIAPDDSDALLSEALSHAENPDHIYEHVWQVGDLVMWDNRCTQHARRDFPGAERRLLRRVGLEGDRPY
ncbi:MAG: TauD/TfdA family dioxygenase [Proteobacteria bacterium]|nr:TauD/TfdA family dioxygenase [Pseudomonadota bacterium]